MTLKGVNIMNTIKKTFDFVVIWIRFQIYKYRLRKAKKHIYGLLLNLLNIYKFTGDFKTPEDIRMLEIFINNLENLLASFYEVYIPAGITQQRFRNKKEVVEFLDLAFQIKRKVFSKGIWGRK